MVISLGSLFCFNKEVGKSAGVKDFVMGVKGCHVSPINIVEFLLVMEGINTCTCVSMSIIVCGRVGEGGHLID